MAPPAWRPADRLHNTERFGISHEGNVCKLRLNLLEHAQVLAADARLIHGQAREIAFGARQAMDKALCDCVSDTDEHDWDRAGLALKRCGHGS